MTVALIAVTLAASSAGFAGQKDPALARYQFTVQVEGLMVGAFREVSGLGVETEVIEVRDGGSNDVRKVPGRVEFPYVTLKRGFTGRRELYDWSLAALEGKGVRRTVTITVSDVKGATVATWTLARAWPTKWLAPSLNASGTDVLIETIELAHDGVTMGPGKK